MKIKAFVFYFSLILTGLIGGCEYRSVPVPPEEQVPSLKQYHVFRAEDMPLAVGNWWQYICPPNTGFSDTVTLIITGMSQEGNTRYYFTQVYCHFNGVVCDSGMFTVSDTLLTYTDIFMREYSIFPEMYIKLPFSVMGGIKPETYPWKWSGPLGYDDTTYSYGFFQHKVLNKDYSLFSLRRIANGVDLRIYNNIWLAPDIGIIYNFMNQRDSSYIFMTDYKLYDYHVQNGKK